MRTLRSIPAVLATVLCCSAHAQPPSQPALKHLSGEFMLRTALDLTYGGVFPFSAQLLSQTGETCQLNGKLRVHEGSPHRVEAVLGATFIHCPGAAPALVVGHFAPANWVPPQARRCRGYSYSKFGSSCIGYSVTASAGASGMWVTREALTSEPVAPKKAVRHD